MRPFVSVDACPWDVAELPEWQEALRRACAQWRQDASATLAQVGGLVTRVHVCVCFGVGGLHLMPANVFSTACACSMALASLLYTTPAPRYCPS